MRPGQDPGEDAEGIVGAALALLRQPVAPVEELAANARIGQRLHWHVAEVGLDLADMTDVALPGRLGEIGEGRRLLVSVISACSVPS